MRHLGSIACAVLVGACAAPPKHAESPAQESVAAPAAPPPPPEPSGPATSPPSAGAGPEDAYGRPERQAALSQAARELEASSRELDVAAGDCKNACRALSSMDRAAGRLCTMAASPDEQRRCADAKQRLYSARDRVRTTCGTCPDGTSVERDAPVPSR